MAKKYQLLINNKDLINQNLFTIFSTKNHIQMKKELSKIKTCTTIGFLYWLHETHNLRGLKNVKIEEYPVKLNELEREYLSKYPNGLVGWNE